MSIVKHRFSDSGLSATVDFDGWTIKVHDCITGHDFGLTKDDACALARHFGLIGEWVSADERDPGMHQRVMVATVDCDDNPIVSICTFNHGGRYLATGGARDKDVTHWMPLPQPPAKKGD